MQRGTEETRRRMWWAKVKVGKGYSKAIFVRFHSISHLFRWKFPMCHLVYVRIIGLPRFRSFSYFYDRFVSIVPISNNKRKRSKQQNSWWRKTQEKCSRSALRSFIRSLATHSCYSCSEAVERIRLQDYWNEGIRYEVSVCCACFSAEIDWSVSRVIMLTHREMIIERVRESSFLYCFKHVISAKYFLRKLNHCRWLIARSAKVCV